MGRGGGGVLYLMDREGAQYLSGGKIVVYIPLRWLNLKWPPLEFWRFLYSSSIDSGQYPPTKRKERLCTFIKIVVISSYGWLLNLSPLLWGHAHRRAVEGYFSRFQKSRCGDNLPFPLSPLTPPPSSLLLRAGLNATAQLDLNCLRQKETKQTDWPLRRL